MALSAQTLFHFTQLDYLKKIIEAKAFFPRYCFEAFINQEDFIVAYPMVCFCDIPLSQISAHAKAYNSNGIGLKKDWGIKRGMNPVFYLQKESYPSKMILEASMDAISKQKEIGEGKSEVQTGNREFLGKFFELTAYYKSREGKTWIKENNGFLPSKSTKTSPQKDKITNFYDEREWRYVPQLKRAYHPQQLPVNFLLKDSYYSDGIFNKDKFEEMNLKLEEYKLSFNASDVKYIIVSTEPEITGLADFITNLKESTYTDREKNLLISKIISLTQIKEDF
jgi:hypothetical protein